TMKADRAGLVKELESKGSSEAQAIKSRAQANARRIEEFAKAYAEEIRRKGNEEATSFVAQMAEAPELAVFLKQIDFIRNTLSKRITWIVDTTMPGFELMSPGAMRKAATGEIPGVRTLLGEVPQVTAQTDAPVAPQPQPEGGR